MLQPQWKEIYDRVYDDIVTLRLKPGEKISEIKLAKRYETGRASARTVILKLQEEGFLVVKPQVGTVILPISEKKAQDILQIRFLLEPFAAEKAAMRINDSDIERLQDKLEKLHLLPAGSDKKLGLLAEVDGLLHDTIWRYSGNNEIESLLSRFHPEIKRTQLATRGLKRDRSIPSEKEIRVILDALQRHDPAVAKEAMCTHILNIDAVLKFFNNHQESGDNELSTSVSSRVPSKTFVKNRDLLLHGKMAMMRKHALDMVDAAIATGIPGLATHGKVRRKGSILTVDGEDYQLSSYRRIVILGAGKAAFPIAEALEDILGDYLSDGLIVVKKGEKGRLRRIRVLESAHPTPDKSSVEAGKKLLAMAEGCGSDDLALMVVTGGATSLATVPLPGLTLKDIAVMNDLVLTSGATIREMNIVRRHLCKLKGGRLAVAAQPATVLTFTLDTALSGMPWPDMCLPDPNTFVDAIAVLRQYSLWDKTPASVRNFLEKNDQALETIKSFKDVNCRMIMVGAPLPMCQAAASKAMELGYAPLILSTRMNGEAREVGICLAGIASEVITHGLPLAPPCALISGGESVVSAGASKGKGGPNQELVLGFVTQLGGTHPWVCASVDTDGTDGPTDIAGGIVDNFTQSIALGKGMDIQTILSRHDASPALTELDGAIYTDQTGTNLQHLRVVLIGDNYEKES
jgi:glycerate-2-kinase/DNA-binding GntR family transcriptional regulator